MTGFGLALSSEEHRPQDLVRFAGMAEQSGLDYCMISDHYHPWIEAQGQSAFVWSTIGAISQATSTLRLGTGVTCPTVRIHPATIAQAAATAASLMPGRFWLGLGSGELLNEHITGEKWERPAIRLDMLAEAIEIIRELWKGDETSFEGDFFRLENARIYTLPDELPPIFVAASAEKSAELAAENDGLVSTGPNEKMMKAYEGAGGKGPRIGQIDVCWAASEAEAKKLARQVWPNAALPGTVFTEIATPDMFDALCQELTEEQVAQAIICGPNPEKYLQAAREYTAGGFDHITFHQVGPDQEGFLSFFNREIRPALDSARGTEAA